MKSAEGVVAFWKPLQAAAWRAGKTHVRGLVDSPAVLIIVLIMLAVLIEPTLFNARAIRNVLVASSPLMIVAAGQAIVILIGGVDLSVGSVISLTNVIAATLIQAHPDMTVSIIALALAAGMAVGTLNGFLVAYARLNPLIITLAVAMAVQGISLEILYQPGGAVDPEFRRLMLATIGPLPISTMIVIGCAVLLAFAMRHTSYGISLHAIGGNEAGARLSGVATERLKLSAYMMSGALSALAGLYLNARISSGDPLVGEPYSLDSITAAVLGGTSLVGGVLSLAGSLAAAVLLTLINTFLNLKGVSPFYQWIIKGLILIVALSVDFLRRRRA